MNPLDARYGISKDSENLGNYEGSFLGKFLDIDSLAIADAACGRAGPGSSGDIGSDFDGGFDSGRPGGGDRVGDQRPVGERNVVLVSCPVAEEFKRPSLGKLDALGRGGVGPGVRVGGTAALDSLRLRCDRFRRRS